MARRPSAAWWRTRRERVPQPVPMRAAPTRPPTAQSARESARPPARLPVLARERDAPKIAQRSDRVALRATVPVAGRASRAADCRSVAAARAVAVVAGGGTGRRAEADAGGGDASGNAGTDAVAAINAGEVCSGAGRGRRLGRDVCARCRLRTVAQREPSCASAMTAAPANAATLSGVRPGAAPMTTGCNRGSATRAAARGLEIADGRTGAFSARAGARGTTLTESSCSVMSPSSASRAKSRARRCGSRWFSAANSA